MADKIKLLVAFLLLVAGVAGFYYLHESAAALRFAVVLLGVVLAAAVVYASEPGKRIFAFGKESVAEAKRVSWPTRRETMQATGVVILFAVTMSLFLWMVDAGLMAIVNALTGRGE